nr:hypothetical protein [Halovivax limisalsi]
MRSRGEAGESPNHRECYRCERGVGPSSCFAVEVEPPAALSEKYENRVRYCCGQCAAGMNLPDVSRRWKAGARRRGVAGRVIPVSITAIADRERG